MADAAVLALLERLRTSWPKPSWSWDGRFAMVSSAVSGAEVERARAAASAELTHVFDATTLDRAPTALRTIVEDSGGLRGNQLAFCDEAITVVGLWWPWGSGGNVSLRVGLVTHDDAALRAAFAVAA